MKKYVGSLFLLICIVVICLIISVVPHKKQTIQIPAKMLPPDETVQISVSMPVESSPCPEGATCGALVIPDNPPGTIKFYGSLENSECYSPLDPKCLVDRTAEVVGGQITHTYTVPPNTYMHTGAVLNNTYNLKDIQINGTPVTTFASLGKQYNMWPVACLIVRDSQTRVVTIDGNPNCHARAYSLRIRVTGGSNNKNPFKDLIAPYTGTKAGEEIKLQTSLWLNPMPGGIWQSMPWDPRFEAYTEFFPTILSDQSAYFALYHPSRNPVAAPGTYEPAFGTFADVMDPKTGQILCSSELVHYLDIDQSPGYWFAAVIDGINPANSCVIQGVDTRGVVVTGP